MVYGDALLRPTTMCTWTLSRDALLHSRHKALRIFFTNLPGYRRRTQHVDDYEKFEKGTLVRLFDIEGRTMSLDL